MKFTQPVSMKCSQEQYNRDLKEPLLAMGYREHCLTLNGHGDEFIATNIGGGNHNTVSDIYFEYKNRHGRYFIEEYNPELFLALAGMTDSEKGNIGECWRCTDARVSNFISGNLYIQLTSDIKNKSNFLDEGGDLSGWCDLNLSHFTKATKEEIINHFSNKKLNTTMEKVIVKKSEFKPLYDAACADWKTRFDNVLKSFVFTDEIEFTSDFVNDMRDACTADQRKIFNTIFKEVDKNAFIKPINGSYIESVSNELFGNKYVLDKANAAALNINRPDLKGRAFYINSNYEVKLHPTGEGNVIEILKK
jgi:hypothetical protein